ncbi:ribosomal s18 [Fusarium beomiforme]|uniref:Small ribosomal subunit protein bS18m n=1 Tax=Fusarium beomiforme TaxID=44412 RepID=A0A9P5DW95_9HYPO|nr:ribosomal s18 [Fusarium beomiforme]
MPLQLPTPSTALAISRTVARSFSTTTATSAPGRHSPSAGHTSRLASLNSSSKGEVNRGSRGDAAARLLDRFKKRTNSYTMEKASQMEFLKNQKVSNDFLKQMPRRWEAGDVYSPHDLSPVEMQKWRKKTVRNNDVIDALGISPLDMYKNFSLIEYFTSASGMINHSNLTRLRPVNQRKVAKMVRRVQGMGIYPSVHAHPEMLRDQFFERER